MMKKQNLLVGKKLVFLLSLIAILAVTVACGLGGGKSANPPTEPTTPPASSSEESPSIAETASETGEAQQDQAGSTGGISESFPLPEGTTINSDSINEDDPDRGSFKLDTTAPLSDLVDFYQSKLPAQGWTYRYTDANYLGGVTQYWKYIEKYISVQFGYDQNEEVVRVDYVRVGPDATVQLPKDFPLPENAEFTRAGDTSWNIYVAQDYAAVNSFYAKASSGWSKCSGFISGAMEGECGGDCGGPNFPQGVTPMPAPTRDARPWKDYCWVLPDKNQVELTIAPHGDATLLVVDVTSLNASDADLPEGIQVYPGATIQNASPGMVMFQANASLEKVKAFYQDSLKAAGWSSNGEPVSSGKAVLMNWQKGNQTVMFTIGDIGNGTSQVVIMVQ
jgi:hypothetical protein